MTFPEVTLQVPGQNNEIMVKTVHLNPGNVFYVLKQPFQPIFIAGLGFQAMIPSIPNFDLTKFITREEGDCYINPKHVLFYENPELGVYVFTFPDSNRLAVKATGAEVQKFLLGRENGLVS